MLVQGPAMKTSKGTIQGYNGIATVDSKHQIIVDAQAFGSGPEQHTFIPVLDAVKDRFDQLGISPDIYAAGTIVTADTGFSSEANMAYLQGHAIDGYVPDNKFRQRDPRLETQKARHGRRRPLKQNGQLSAADFDYDAEAQTCLCPNNQPLRFRQLLKDKQGRMRAHFEGRVSQCRDCPLKARCMRNPAATGTKGRGRQVSFAITPKTTRTKIDWMKERIDTEHGRHIYGMRLAVEEPVFGNIGSNKGLNRFSLRGKRKVQAQWRLFCMIHNIEKIANYGQLAA